MKSSLSAFAVTPALVAVFAAKVCAQDAVVDLQPLSVEAESELANQITAFRTGTPLIDVPQSVAVFDKERLQAQAVDSIGDIIDYTPGVITSQGEGHRDAVVFRGIRSTADFFVDGVRDDVQYYRPIYNIEQVEILRGPNALTFGRGGVGGVLNRVTKKAEFGDTFFEWTGRVNTFGATYNGFDYNTQLSDDVAFRLNLFNEQLDNHRDFYDGNRIGVNPTLTLRLADDTELFLSYEYIDHDRFIDRGIPVGANGRPAQSLTGTTFGDSELNENTVDAHTFTATLKHRFNDQWRGRVTAFYGKYDKVYTNYFASDYTEATNQVEIDGYIDRVDRDTFSMSGDLIGEFFTGEIDHKVLVGAEYVHTESLSDRFNNVWASKAGGPGSDRQLFNAANFRMSNGQVLSPTGAVLDTGTFSSLNDRVDVDIDVYSVFLQDEISFGDKLDVVLGARFDSFDIEARDLRRNVSFSRRDSEVTPRLGLIYKPVENVSLYASYSETFLPRSGEQFADINGGTSGIANSALDPNTFSNLEAGVKWNVDNNWDISLAAFQIDASSPQTADGNPGTLDVIDTETVGFEVMVDGNVTDWWHVAAGYAYLDGEQFNRMGNTGLDPREQPKNTFSVWNSFRVHEKVGLGLGMIYQDESFADNGNTATLPSYVRFDASAYYDFSADLRVQLNVENLLDRDYFPNAHRASNVTVGAPINAALTITKRF